MDAIFAYVVFLVGGSVLFLTSPFCRYRVIGGLWLLVSLMGFGAVVTISSVAERSMYLLLAAAIMLQALVGVSVLLQQYRRLILAFLTAYGAASGWFVARIYGSSPFLAMVCALAFVTWVVLWRKRILTPVE